MTLFQRFWAATTIVAYIVFGSPDALCQTVVSTDNAVTVANNWLHLGQEMNWGWKNASVFKPSSAKEIHENGELVGYCLTVPGGGYILVPAYRELPPITAYSTESVFDLGAQSGFCALIREQLRYKLDLVRSCLSMTATPPEWAPVMNAIEHDRELWQAYTASYDLFSQALVAENTELEPARHPRNGPRYNIDDTGPLLTTSWHQSSPFNNFCPMGDGGRTVVGCVACACSQIMDYWRYPTTGTGSHSFAWNGDQSCGHDVSGGTLSASYSDSYDWANMLDQYVGGETQTQLDAVAELNYEVGVALNMDYGACGSGANTAYVANILPQYFAYASDIEVQYRTSYATAAAWFAMLQEDLNLNRPMQYRISSHSIVCDGWRVSGTNQVHMNYGWNDGHTAWYTVDNLYCTWAGCSPTVEYVVRHIHPAAQASLDITAPNGGEVWLVGEQHNIAWTSQNLPGNVRIELNRTYPSGSWETLNSNAPNNGLFTWTVTAPECSTARARVTSVSNPQVSDVSDGDFVAVVLSSPQIVVNVEGTGIRLAWISNGAPYYKVYSAFSAGGPITAFEGSTSDTTFVDSSPVLDQKFYTVTSSSTP